MMTGQAGCGKTLAAKSLINALDRPEFYFNLGATQDPRSTLIGNVHFDKRKVLSLVSHYLSKPYRPKTRSYYWTS